MEAEKKENQRKRMREEREEEKKDLDEEDPFDKIRATAKENFAPKSPQLSVSVSNGSKVISLITTLCLWTTINNSKKDPQMR